MASKSKQKSDPLNVVLKVAEEMIDSASHALSETVEVVSKLNEPLLKAEADMLEHISPTAAELLRPKRSRKNDQTSDDKTKKVKAGEASKKGSGHDNQRKTKASGSPKMSAKHSKKKEDRDTTND